MSNIKTTKKQIAEYWMKHNNICETELNFDWSEAETHCWNCGDNKYRSSTKKTSLERCHIIPSALNGEDTPSNYVLLCDTCHSEAPNTSNPNDMWNWIKSNHIGFAFYGTYTIRKALVLFKQKHGYSFIQKVIGIENFQEILTKELLKTNTHGHRMNVSTYYYMFKTIVENYSR